MLNDFLFRLRCLFRRNRAETDLEDELRFHREQQLTKYMQSGLTKRDAQRRLGMSFGEVGQVKEECRDAWGVRMLETLVQDLQYGARVLRKSPGFTAVALLTLALGIGANTAIFSILYGVLLRPLPFRDASRLVVLHETTPKVGAVSVSYPNFLDWRAQSKAFGDMAAVTNVGFSLSGIGQPENVSGEAVSPNFLSMLGVHPILGRDFNSSEEKKGAAAVVLLSYPLWQSHFGGDRTVVGKTIALDGHAFTIIGVLPPHLRWTEKMDLLEPAGIWATNNPASQNRSDRDDTVVLGKLATLVTFEQADAEMRSIAVGLAKAYPGANAQFGVSLQSIRDVFVSDIRPSVLTLFVAVTLVLLIACANVANLFLMRGATRGREFALRMAIGAGRGRLVAQMMAESLILTALGGLAGLVLATLIIRGLSRLIPADMLAGATLDLNGPALLFAGMVVALATFVFGWIPTRRAARSDLQLELRAGGRSTGAAAAQSRWRNALVVIEISLALVLTVGAGLMMKTLAALLSVDAGIRTEHLLTMQLDLRTAQYDHDPAILNFWDNLLNAARKIPGVRDAALGTGVPLTNAHSRNDITVEGAEIPKPGAYPHPDIHIISSGYVDTLGMRLVRGRAFSDADNEHAPRVAMINALAAKRLFRERDPIGKRLLLGHMPAKGSPEWLTVVGIVGDTKLYGLANPSRLEVYVPFHQNVSGSMRLLVKSALDPSTLTAEIRNAVASLDKDQPVYEIATMSQYVSDSLSTRRITFVVLGCFSALALLLSGVGVYGVSSYSVAQREREIGIRMALGARPYDVVAMILSEGSKTAAVGILAGIVASLSMTRLMTSLLFSVKSTDPFTFLVVAVSTMLIALIASYIPAQRALRAEPTDTLRAE